MKSKGLRKNVRTQMITASAMVISLIPAGEAFASAPPGFGGPASACDPNGQNFGCIGSNMTTSISAMPGLLSGASYLLALMLGSTAVLKIKDHVENPQQTPIKAGAIRLLAGGALFALPVVFEAMFHTVDSSPFAFLRHGPTAAALNRVAFNVN